MPKTIRLTIRIPENIKLELDRISKDTLLPINSIIHLMFLSQFSLDYDERARAKTSLERFMLQK